MDSTAFVPRPAPSEPALRIGMLLVTRHDLRLAIPGDARLAGLESGYELAATSVTGRYTVFVGCYTPPAEPRAAADDLRRRLAAALQWGRERMATQGSIRADVLLVALGPVAPLNPQPAAESGEVRVGAICLDPRTNATVRLAGNPRGVPSSRELRQAVEAGSHGVTAPTLAAIDLAERQQVASGYSRRANSISLTAGPRNRGIIAAIGAVLLGVLKYGALILKVGLVGPTMISLVASLFAAVLLYGWVFGVGIVVLIGIHELGHMIMAMRYGLPVSGPTFLGPFGAFVRHGHAHNADQQTAISLAGPAFGVGAAAVCVGLGLLLPIGAARALLSLGSFALFINVMNLMPLGFLDGAKIGASVRRWAYFVGAAGATAAFLVGETITGGGNALVLVMAAAVAFVGWRRRGLSASPSVWQVNAVRSPLSVASLTYAAAVIIAGVGMTAATGVLVPAGGSRAAPAWRPGSSGLASQPEANLLMPGAALIQREERAAWCDSTGPQPARLILIYRGDGDPGRVTAWYAPKLEVTGWQGSGDGEFVRSGVTGTDILTITPEPDGSGFAVDIAAHTAIAC